MTKLYSTPPDAVLVAIDMSKHRQEVLLERPEGGRRRRMTVMATKADYDRLAGDLTAIGRPVIVGFEATGNYHRTLAHRLLSAGFELRLISSVALARTREALHNGWDKNDSKDAQVILHMLKIGATGTVRISVCGRAVKHYAAMALMKRSPNRTANWALAMDHSRGGMVHSFSVLFKTRNSSLVAASSLGKCPLALTARRS